ncbi:unnamed protein product, partial [Iphiclides podalirius]
MGKQKIDEGEVGQYIGLVPQIGLDHAADYEAARPGLMPRRDSRPTIQDVCSKIIEDNDKFQVNLDVKHFGPEEISVKIANGCFIVEALHEERADKHGWYTSRNFKRRYPLPGGVDLDAVTSTLSSDGVLSITAPIKTPKDSDERIVPIVTIGPMEKQGRKKVFAKF